MAWTLKLRHQAGPQLTPYPVVTTPPPPHRVEDSANKLTNGQEQAIDVDGFNPIYHYSGVSVGDPSKPNGFIVQLALQDDPATILVVTFRYKAKPGSEGNDPAKQPKKIAEFPFTDLKEGDYVLIAESALQNFRLEPVDSGSGQGQGSGCLLFPVAWLLSGIGGT